MNDSHFHALYRDSGLRFTAVRRELVRLFSVSSKPLSVSDLLERLGRRGVQPNKTTVYRELETLQKLGVIQPVSLGERAVFYERLAQEHHHHLVCLGCERVEDVHLDEQAIRREERRLGRQGFLVSRHALEFFGWCIQCRT
ncbi:MAG: Fur family transcriptional regulator [Candidatus Moraniibacteriota bacterium]